MPEVFLEYVNCLGGNGCQERKREREEGRDTGYAYGIHLSLVVVLHQGAALTTFPRAPSKAKMPRVVVMQKGKLERENLL